MKLNLPSYPLKIKTINEKSWVFDEIRKKFVSAGPEEWVRQYLVHYLIKEKAYPKSLISIEKELLLNEMRRRTDVLVYTKNGEPLMIIECKAPSQKINQKTFEQAARYNLSLKVPYLLITNGLQHYCCTIDWKKNSFDYLAEIPAYHDLTPR